MSDSNSKNAKKTEFDQHVEKCLSMIYHHPEIEKFAAVVKKIGYKRLGKRSVTNE